MNPAPLIELRSVDVATGLDPTAVALRAVDWRIGQGEFWVVAGGAASGKSALLATAAGLRRPVAGAVRIFDAEVSTATERQQIEWRRRIGFVFENGGRLFSHLTVAENIALPVRYHLDQDEPAVRRQAQESLATAGLSSYADRLPAQLSARLQQRVALLRAMAVSPSVLFLDSPLTRSARGDISWWRECLGRLRTPSARGEPVLTVVVTDDDFRRWLDLADQFALIQDRRLRLLGTRQQLDANPEPIVREFLMEAI
jgi:phospholipid/cholesterol/gamma-HCH transport system ATP-binding protein